MAIGLLFLVTVLQLINNCQCETIDILVSLNESCQGQCSTLEQYATTPTQSSHVVLRMQSGNHTLSSQLSISNKENLTMIGSNAQVICTSSTAQISLTSIQHVLIVGVSFIGCRQNSLSTNGDTVEIQDALFQQNMINFVDSVNTLIVKNSVFNGNMETGIDFRNYVNSATIEGCHFIDNGYRGLTIVSADNIEIKSCTFLRNRGPHGGCIRAEDSSVTITDSSFTECSSIGGRDGGAIYGDRVTFTITNTNFTDNRGYGGAGIAGFYSSFNITSSNFIGNIGTQWGGAIKASTGTRSLTVSDTNFISNTALLAGGIFTEFLSSITCCNFVNNTALTGDGGGLVVQTSRSFTLSYSNFINNTNLENGGGTYINVRSNVDDISVNIIGCSFMNNVAGNGNGGGVYFNSNGQRASMNIIETTFLNNTAIPQLQSNAVKIIGGGVYLSGGNSSISVFESDFSMNSASGNGGGLYVSGSVLVNGSNFTQNSAVLGEGGAIQSCGNSANITLVDSSFVYNSAPSCGVLDVNEHYHTVDIRRCIFSENKATGVEIGGGVGCINSAIMTVLNSTMNHNTANGDGGVFHINDGTVEIQDSDFLNNSAVRNGGAIYTYVHRVSYNIHLSTFSRNTASGDGGALFIGRRGSNVKIDESIFSYNSAENKGGVISIIGSAAIFNNTSTYNNTANKGDIISACNSVISVYVPELVQMHSSNDVCTYFSRLDSAGIDEAINTTSDTSQTGCTDCDLFTVLTSTDNYCPGEFTGDPCLTLQQYAGSTSNQQNISLLLEPGNHTLSGELIATNGYNFTITGVGARVICNTVAAQISLTSIQHVLIVGVSFIGCRQNSLSTNGNTVEIQDALFQQNTINFVDSVNTLIVKNSVFNGNMETGIDFRNYVNSATIEGCHFIDNGYRGLTIVSADNIEIKSCTFLRNCGPHGGCIRADDSTITITDSSFTECSSIGGRDGGAIYGDRVTFTITNTNFTDNRGYGGAGIAGLYSSFNITSSNFIGNIGTQWGGAIKASTGTRSLTVSDTNFISNTALLAGGIFTEFLSSITCCNFVNNTALTGDGGGLVVQTSRSFTLSYSNFINNTNLKNGGGAFINVRSNVDDISVNIIGCSFMNNIAGDGNGGGVYFKSNGQCASMNITETTIRNNTAIFQKQFKATGISGGGVYLSGGNSLVSVTSSDISMNSATANGGAIYVTGSVFVYDSNISNNKVFSGLGGAIVSNGENAHLNLIQSMFYFNNAPSCGAVQVMNSNSTVNLVNSSFAYNEATTNTSGLGGGVVCFSNSSISVTNDCNFLHNSAGSHGGAFFIQNSTFNIEDSYFFNNSASQDGGVIFASDGTMLQDTSRIYGCTFSHNMAGNDGGVLFVTNNDHQIMISRSTFSDNIATNRGGAIHANQSTLYFNTTNIFNNSAALGDSISVCDTTVTFMNASTTESTDPSDSSCRIYEENIDFFRETVPHNVVINIDTTTNGIMVTCPFNYDDNNIVPIDLTTTTSTTATTNVDNTVHTTTNDFSRTASVPTTAMYTEESTAPTSTTFTTNDSIKTDTLTG